MLQLIQLHLNHAKHHPVMSDHLELGMVSCMANMFALFSARRKQYPQPTSRPEYKTSKESQAQNDNKLKKAKYLSPIETVTVIESKKNGNQPPA